jgi:hypothetical protein
MLLGVFPNRREFDAVWGAARRAVPSPIAAGNRPHLILDVEIIHNAAHLAGM